MPLVHLTAREAVRRGRGHLHPEAQRPGLPDRLTAAPYEQFGDRFAEEYATAKAKHDRGSDLWTITTS